MFNLMKPKTSKPNGIIIKNSGVHTLKDYKIIKNLFSENNGTGIES